jgi:hypothetical protein
VTGQSITYAARNESEGGEIYPLGALDDVARYIALRHKDTIITFALTSDGARGLSSEEKKAIDDELADIAQASAEIATHR